MMIRVRVGTIRRARRSDLISLDERVLSFSFYRFVHPPHRRTRRDGLARDATTRRWMMNRIVAIDHATTDRAIDADGDHHHRDDGVNETRERHTRARE